MKAYISNYRSRISGIALSIVLSFSVALLGAFIFGKDINNLSGQFERYQKSEHSILYILNYGIHTDNELIFADTDIQLFSDKEGNQRLTVSCLMSEPNAEYTLSELTEINKLESDEIIISNNVAEKYDLEIGDTVFVQYPFSGSLYTVSIVGIGPTEYDLTNPIISNQIGLVYLGINQEYLNSTKYRCILFAKNSEASLLADYPQVISSVINKSDNMNNVFSQGVYVLLFEMLFVIAMVIICEHFLFSSSFAMLKRVFLKGSSRSIMIIIPLVERIIFLCIPEVIGCIVSLTLVPCNSEFTITYYCIPMVVTIFYILIMLLKNCIRIR